MPPKRWHPRSVASLDFAEYVARLHRGIALQVSPRCTSFFMTSTAGVGRDALQIYSTPLNKTMAGACLLRNTLHGQMSFALDTCCAQSPLANSTGEKVPGLL